MSGNWYYTGTWNKSQSRFILQSMPWMLMIWQCKEPRHQQQCVEMQVVLEYSNLSTRNSLIQWGQDKMVAILASNIFRCIFLNENIQILTKISQNFVPKGPINNIPALIQITAWHRPVDKPLMVSLQMSMHHSASMNYDSLVERLEYTKIWINSLRLSVASTN